MGMLTGVILGVTLDEQLKVANRNLSLRNSTLRMIRLQYASAQVNALAVEQSAAQKNTAELLIPLAYQNIAVLMLNQQSWL